MFDGYKERGQLEPEAFGYQAGDALPRLLGLTADIRQMRLHVTGG
jgi:hypothetical protein